MNNRYQYYIAENGGKAGSIQATYQHGKALTSTCMSKVMKNMFNLQCTVTHTSRVTRSHVSSGIALPSVHSRTGYYSLSFLAADRWNSLPASLRSISSSTLFSQQLRLLLGFSVRRRPSVG